MPMRFLAQILLVAVLASCDNATDLEASCPKTCYPDSWTEEQQGIGVCALKGEAICDEYGTITDCVIDFDAIGYSLKETCDGRDNNCDGFVDNGYFPDNPGSWGNTGVNPCGPGIIGECRKSKIECIDGEYHCLPADTIEQGDEVSCDGLDNDCDGRIDEMDPRGFCYDGDWWQATNGQCRAGLEVCSNSQWVCQDQVLPSPETCDGTDNNCDGFVDNVDVPENLYDIAILLDTSGSMCPKISAVAGSLDAYLNQFMATNQIRFAIINFSTLGTNKVTVVEDFNDPATIAAAISQIGCNGSAKEASLDGLEITCNASNPLGLSWRPEANRLIFLFSDELPQTDINPANTAATVISSCDDTRTIPYVWTTANFPFNGTGDSFLDITDPLGGTVFPLTNDWEELYDDMNTIFFEYCGILSPN